MKRLKNFRDYHIFVGGCGGTGSNLVPHLVQLVGAYQYGAITIVLCDEDRVEKGNIGRQFFISPDVGNNKAAVLQKRYLAAWDVDISYHPYYIRETDVLLKLLKKPEAHEHRTPLPILVGAVDNDSSRRIFHEAFYKLKDIAYIDAGNSKFNGQVVVGLRINGETILKPLAEYYPDVMTTQDEISVGGTCGRVVKKEPQTLVANLWAAMITFSFINNIVNLKELPSHMATFNAHNILTRPEYLKSRKEAGVDS
jgi:hypothetical protein